MPSKYFPLIPINAGIPWLLNVSHMISRYAPMAAANSSVLSELRAKLPVCWCPRNIKSANTVIAILVSYLSIMALVSNCLVPPELSSSSLKSHGSIIPSVSSRLILFTIFSSPAYICTIWGSSLSHISIPCGACITGSPARSLSMPMPSISWIRFLKYHERYAFLKILLPSGLSFLLLVLKCNAFSAGIVHIFQSGGASCVIPNRLSSLSYSHWYNVSCARTGSFIHPIRPSLYLLLVRLSFVLPIRRLYTISW